MLTPFGGSRQNAASQKVTGAGIRRLRTYDAIGLANLVRQKAVSPDDLLEAAIERRKCATPPSTPW
jgi:hypothetical protein